MAGSCVFAVRRALRTLLVADLDPIPVYMGEPGGFASMPVVWLGGTRTTGPEGSQESAGMRSTPHGRIERIDFDVIVQDRQVDAIQAETELETTMTSIETLIAADPTLGAVSGLLWIRVADYNVTSTQADQQVLSTGLLTLRMVGRIG